MSDPTQPPAPDADYPMGTIYIQCRAPWPLRARFAWFLVRTALTMLVPFGWQRDPAGRLRPHWRAGLTARAHLGAADLAADEELAA